MLSSKEAIYKKSKKETKRTKNDVIRRKKENAFWRIIEIDTKEEIVLNAKKDRLKIPKAKMKKDPPITFAFEAMFSLFQSLYDKYYSKTR